MKDLSKEILPLIVPSLSIAVPLSSYFRASFSCFRLAMVAPFFKSITLPLFTEVPLLFTPMVPLLCMPALPPAMRALGPCRRI
ncbi:hypothetical protein CAAR111675_06290 [Campylobacter armoricus]